MDSLLDQITSKKNKLDQHRPLPRALERALDKWFRVGITYTSNALEGNTLSWLETALVVERNIKVEEKNHLQVSSHVEAIDYVLTLARKSRQITKYDLCKIHHLVIPNPIAGWFLSMRANDLIIDFIGWLQAANHDHPVHVAAEAHYRLLSINPFEDGSGRTARLLMNLLLLQAGYPPALIRPQDRLAYLGALERGQTTGATDDYYQLIYQAVDRSLDIYLRAVVGEPPGPTLPVQPTFVSRQALAKLSGMPTTTIVFYADVGLLPFTQAGTRLGRWYERRSALARLEAIRLLQDQGMTIKEIKRRLDDIRDESPFTDEGEA